MATSSIPLTQTVNKGEMLRRTIEEAAAKTNDPMLLNLYQVAEGLFTNAGARVSNVFEDLARALPASGVGKADRLSKVDSVLRYMVDKGRLAMADADPSFKWVAGSSREIAERNLADLVAKNPNIARDAEVVGKRLGDFADSLGWGKMADAFRDGFIFKAADASTPRTMAELASEGGNRPIRGVDMGKAKDDEFILFDANPTEFLQKRLKGMADHHAVTKVQEVLAGTPMSGAYAKSVSDAPEVRAERIAKLKEEVRGEIPAKESRAERVIRQIEENAIGKGSREQARARVKAEIERRKVRDISTARGDVVKKREKAHAQALARVEQEPRAEDLTRLDRTTRALSRATDETRPVRERKHGAALDRVENKDNPGYLAERYGTVDELTNLDKATKSLSRSRRAMGKAVDRLERSIERTAKSRYNAELQARANAELEKWVAKRAEARGMAGTSADLGKVRKEDFSDITKLVDADGNVAYVISRKGFLDLFEADKTINNKALKAIGTVRKLSQQAVFTLANGLAPFFSAMYNAQTHFSRLGLKASAEMLVEAVPLAFAQYRALFSNKEWAHMFQQSMRSRGFNHDPYAGKSGTMNDIRFRELAGGIDQAIAKWVQNPNSVSAKAMTRLGVDLAKAIVLSPITVVKALNKLTQPLSPIINRAASNAIYRRRVKIFEDAMGAKPTEAEQAIIRAASDLESTRHMDESRTMSESFKSSSAARNAVANTIIFLNNVLPFARPQFMDMISTASEAVRNPEKMKHLASIMALSAGWAILGGEDDTSKLTPDQIVQGAYEVTEDGKVIRKPWAVQGTYNQIARGLYYAGRAATKGNEHEMLQFLAATARSVIPAAKLSEGLTETFSNPFQEDQGHALLQTAVSTFVPTAGQAARELNKNEPSARDGGLWAKAYTEGGTSVGKGINALGALVGVKNTLPGDIATSVISGEPVGRLQQGIGSLMPEREIQIGGLARTKDVLSQLANAGEQVASIRRQAVAANPSVSKAEVNKAVNQQWKAANADLFQNQIPMTAYTIVAKAYELPSNPANWKPSTEKDKAALAHIERLIRQFSSTASGVTR